MLMCKEGQKSEEIFTSEIIVLVLNIEKPLAVLVFSAMNFWIIRF